jgi:hypothetical protein
MDEIESLKDRIKQLETELIILKKENKKLIKQLREQNIARETKSDLKEEMMPSKSPSLKEVESWVKEQIESKGITERVKRILLPINGVEIQGNLDINGKEFPISDLRIIPSPGGGTCLIYSFLTALSLSYRKLSSENKAVIGEEYRTLLSRENFFESEEKQLLSNPKQNLEQEIGKKIAKYLGVNIFYLTQYAIDRPTHMDVSQEIVMILNNNGHYDAVIFPYNLETPKSKVDFYNSIDNIRTTTKFEADGFTESELPSIEEMKRQMNGMGLIQEDDSDLYIAQQYKANFLGGSKRNKLSRKKRKNTKKKNTRRRK